MLTLEQVMIDNKSSPCLGKRRLNVFENHEYRKAGSIKASISKKRIQVKTHRVYLQIILLSVQFLFPLTIIKGERTVS